ncbi:hypothetical protein [Rathayibacter tritici]|uniref:hypothetical protein n=1 Tax=Rathayibacter tritici TaxID=33888 RepID=UPI0011B0054B|nr:hypothetical protein [Rathayibacter tritici]
MQTTTFFIPVLSPSFFESEECRREFLSFYSTAKSLGVTQYLLAIRYAPIEELDPTSVNQAKAIAAEIQYRDWEALRLVDEAGPEHRQAVNGLAQDLRRMMNIVQSQPAAGAAEAVLVAEKGSVLRRKESGSHLVAEDDDDPYGDQPSPLELVADLPDRSKEWTDTMTLFQKATEDFSAVLNRGSAKLSEVEGRPLAKKLLVLRETAAELDEPTRRIEAAGEQYMQALLAIDPSFKALAEIGHSQRSEPSEKDRNALKSAQESIRSMVGAGVTASRSVQGAIEKGRALARISRDLRAPLKRYEIGSRNIIDGQGVMEEWLVLIESVEWPEAVPSAAIARE